MNMIGNERKNLYTTYVSVILGILAGSLLFFIMGLFDSTHIIDQGLEDYKVTGVLGLPVLHLALYVLKRRLGQILLFIIGMLLFSYSIAAFCYCFLFGAYYGVVACSLLVKFGIHGLLYAVMCFFPHYLLYFFAIYLFEKWFKMSFGTKLDSCSNVNKLQKFFKYFVIFFLIVIALIWEIKFQKNILNYFYQYLV